LNLIQIDDINHDDLSIYKKIRENAFSDDDSFIADSPKVVNLLLETDIEIKSILATHEYYAEYKSLIEHKNIKHLYVTKKEELEKIVGHRLHHNCMMHGIRPASVDCRVRTPPHGSILPLELYVRLSPHTAQAPVTKMQ